MGYTCDARTACSEPVPDKKATIKEMLWRTNGLLTEMSVVLDQTIAVLTGEPLTEINNKEPECCLEAAEATIGKAEAALKAALKIRNIIV